MITFTLVNSSTKSIISLILLSVFLLTFSRVIIYADYFINKDYIAKVLCINKDKPKMHCKGKCHLQKQLKEEEKKEQSPVNPIKGKNEVQLFSQNHSALFLFNPVTEEKSTTYYSFHLSEKHLHSVFHPPKV